MAGLEDCFFQFGLIHHDSPVGSLRVWRQKIPRFLIRQVQKRSKKVKLFDGRATLLDPIPAWIGPERKRAAPDTFFLSCDGSWDKPLVAAAGVQLLVVVREHCKGHCICREHCGWLRTQAPFARIIWKKNGDAWHL